MGTDCYNRDNFSRAYNLRAYQVMVYRQHIESNIGRTEKAKVNFRLNLLPGSKLPDGKPYLNQFF
jgi:hypothetical protein